MLNTEANEKCMDVTLYQKLESLMGSGMTNFQMSKFVMDEQLTPYRKVRQAMMEIRTRLETMTTSSFDIEEKKIKLRGLNRDLNNLLQCVHVDETEKELLELKIKRTEYEINRKLELQRQVQSEAEFFISVLNMLSREHFESEEDMVAKLRDPQFHDENERQFWIERLTRNAQADLVNFGTISSGVFQAIGLLEKADQDRIMEQSTTLATNFRLELNSRNDQALIGRD